MSAFWDWAVRAYARPGAAEACLALQDAHGQSVPLLLWVLWRSRGAAPPDAETLARAAKMARQWERAAVGPLRAVRRDLRCDVACVPGEEREAFRVRVKALELEAERLLMGALEALDSHAPEQVSEADLLARAAEAYGEPLPAEAFAPLLARL